jgi:putative transposase
MIKAHQIKLYPTKKQEQFFKCSCGVARFSFNWALAKWKEKYEAKERTSAYTLIKELTAIKRTEYPWMLEVGKTCPQYAIHHVESAFKRFCKKQTKYPKFKKRGVCDSFVTVENKNNFKQKNKKIWIPRLGWVKCAENLRFDGKVIDVIVKRIADMWFAVINIHTIIPNKIPIISENQVIVGVDLGIKALAITSNNEVFKNPKALKSRLSSLKYHQRRLFKKVKGSNNKYKQQIKVARLYYKISCVRNSAIHEATKKIVDNADVIVLEDLNVKGMIKNKKLSQAISDVGFGEFRRQIEYKAKWQGKKVIIADRYFASSKTCSCCGFKKDELKLSERTYVCLNCGLVIDRDLNAAINLAKYGSTQGICESNACGVGSSVVEMQYSPTLKQELVINSNINN